MNLADENHDDPREPLLRSLTADSLTEDRRRQTMTAISDDRQKGLRLQFMENFS